MRCVLGVLFHAYLRSLDELPGNPVTDTECPLSSHRVHRFLISLYA
jgi:hypothetical protein